jgi:hypothetical protein
VDWASKSVVELEAFLRARGMDLGGRGKWKGPIWCKPPWQSPPRRSSSNRAAKGHTQTVSTLSGSAGLPHVPPREVLGCRVSGADLSVVAGASHPSGPTPPAPEAVPGAVDWASKSVVELEAFLRSQGVDLDLGGEGQLDRATLVEIVVAIVVEQEGQGGRG